MADPLIVFLAAAVVTAFFVVLYVTVLRGLIFPPPAAPPAAPSAAPSASPSGSPTGPSVYKLVVNAEDPSSLRRYFVFDNPNKDGSDPTVGNVDYSAPMTKTEDGQIALNPNGDVYWGEIPEKPSKDWKFIAANDDGKGIRIRPSEKLDSSGRAGSVRLSSRSLFYGGLFVFDISHIPVGCGVWPAMWLNGFIGAPNQYKKKEGNAGYEEDMTKLARKMENHTCGKLSSKNLVDRMIDKNMTAFLRKTEPETPDVKMNMWPGSGEVDIMEQVHFSTTTLLSIHAGRGCEVMVDTDNMNGTLNVPFDWGNRITKNGSDKVVNFQDYKYDYAAKKVRSACGRTLESGAPLDWVGKYQDFSGCPDDPAYWTEQDDPTNQLQSRMISKPGNWSRPTCPAYAALYDGNTQSTSTENTWGVEFNKNKGGIVLTQWVPDETLKIWIIPRSMEQKLKDDLKGPFSDAPDPTTWTSSPYKENLQVSYIFNDPKLSRCNFHFMEIVVNLTFGGGWAGGTMPDYCQVNDKKANMVDYMKNCWEADPKSADASGKWTSSGKTTCYDGAKKAEGGRGADADPAFFSEAFFGINSIRVYQTPAEPRVWDPDA